MQKKNIPKQKKYQIHKISKYKHFKINKNREIFGKSNYLNESFLKQQFDNFFQNWQNSAVMYCKTMFA